MLIIAFFPRNDLASQPISVSGSEKSRPSPVRLWKQPLHGHFDSLQASLDFKRYSPILAFSLTRFLRGLNTDLVAKYYTPTRAPASTSRTAGNGEFFTSFAEGQAVDFGESVALYREFVRRRAVALVLLKPVFGVLGGEPLHQAVAGDFGQN